VCWFSMGVSFIVVCVEEWTTIISEIEDWTRSKSGVEFVYGASEDFLGRRMIKF